MSSTYTVTVAGLTPYVHFAGTAREAMTYYSEVFDCSVQLHTFEEFHRDDGPARAIAHSGLVGAPFNLFAADAAGDERPLKCEGIMFSLLGTASSDTLRTWFARLAEGGRVVDELQRRPWGDWDGQVVDRYGLHWLIGFEDDGGVA